MHFDYLAFNLVGHTCYMVYNLGLYSVISVKEEYQRRHPFGANPIAINDIFFPVHAVILCLIAIVQCFCYEVLFHFLFTFIFLNVCIYLHVFTNYGNIFRFGEYG